MYVVIEVDKNQPSRVEIFTSLLDASIRARELARLWRMERIPGLYVYKAGNHTVGVYHGTNADPQEEVLEEAATAG